MLPDSTIDSTTTPKWRLTSLQSFLHSHNLHDAWGCSTCPRETLLFSQPRTIPIFMIHLFLVDKCFLQNIQDTSINDISWSDHASVCLSVDDSLIPRSTFGDPTFGDPINVYCSLRTPEKYWRHFTDFFQLNNGSI